MNSGNHDQRIGAADDAMAEPDPEMVDVALHKHNGEAEPESTGVGCMTAISADDVSHLEFLTVEECAQYLRLDRKTVYSMIKNGDLPGARRCGRTFRVHRQSVISWFTAKSRPVRRGGER